MHRSHSKNTFKADRGIPKEILEPVEINGKKYPTARQRRYAKHEHTRRARNFLKRNLRAEMEESIY